MPLMPGVMPKLAATRHQVHDLRLKDILDNEEGKSISTIKDGAGSGSEPSFEALRKRKYVNLTTFRKSGEAVDTTVWFALVDGRVYVQTGRDSGKVKRIRN